MYQRSFSLLPRCRATLSLVRFSHEANVESISKRKLFKSIVPDPKILTHLDGLELGYLPKKRARVALAKKLGVRPGSVGRHGGRPRPIDFESAPFPFQRRGLPIAQARIAADVPEFPGDPPEIALIGRSNVGKSTLLNALVGFDTSFVQKAEVSPKPGQTQVLNFFVLGNEQTKLPKGVIPKCSMVVVDFPGYGFAFMSDENTKRCTELCSSYLLGNRKNLKRVLLLIDARHGLKVNDKEYFRELMYGHSSTVLSNSVDDEKETKPLSMKQVRSGIHWKLQIVLTKCDLVERDDLARRISIIHREISEALPGFSNMLPIMTVSGLERKGILELQKELAALIPPELSTLASLPDTKKAIPSVNVAAVDPVAKSKQTTQQELGSNPRPNRESVIRRTVSTSIHGQPGSSGNRRKSFGKEAYASSRTGRSKGQKEQN